MDFNLRALEDLGLQLFELFVSFTRTLWHLLLNPRPVFESLRGTGAPGGRDGQERYGDGVIGYTSPVLFFVTGLALQMAIDWSGSFFASSSGLTEADLSVGSLTATLQFLVFTLIAAVMANRALGQEGRPAALREAFYVSCYASGLGIFRTLAFTAALWLSFAGSTMRGREPGLLLLLAGACFALGVGFVAWQLAMFGFGFVRVLGLSVRHAVTTVAASVALMVPLGAVVYLVLAAPTVVAVGRILSLEREARAGRPDLALHHVAYLEHARGFEGGRAQLALRRAQLEAQVCARWLPAFLRLRSQLASVEALEDSTAAVRGLEAAAASCAPSALETAPSEPVPPRPALEAARAAQAKLVAVRLLDPALAREWSVSYPHWAQQRLVLCRSALLAGERDRARRILGGVLGGLDAGILALQTELLAAPERVTQLAAEVSPTRGFNDTVVAFLMLAQWLP